MFGLKTKNQGEFERHWQGTLSDYVTAIAYRPDGNALAASSAAGEVVLFQGRGLERTVLQLANGRSVDCLAFSPDGQYLATGGQDGRINLWRMQPAAPEPIATLGNGTAWVDRLAWSPTQNLLAFSLGKYVQVWDATLGAVVTTLNFDTSSVLDITWHPDGKRLSVGGYQGVKTWTADDWDDDPYLLAIPSASVAIAWSPDGKYIASGNLDRTITVLEWENPFSKAVSPAAARENPLLPWVMRGFPGKIRQLAWSEVLSKTGAPLLAASCVEGLVIWEKEADEALGWDGRVLAGHEETIHSIKFQPHSLLLASAAADGWVYLWQKAKRPTQVFNGASNGFSCLSWHPKGNQLAAGGQNGELLVWSKVGRGQGFG
ncbi:hypothetical protein BCD67_21565 [Oscillatoriales cyanobacterium USR001]|nr:hypothetical protein BCD67_21565 [Oscillatoriales cyanobacterium USR001]